MKKEGVISQGEGWEGEVVFCEIGILKARSLILLGSFSYCSALSIPLSFRDPFNGCHSMTVMSVLCFRSARMAKMDEWLG